MKIITIDNTAVKETVVESIRLSNGTEISAITVGEKGRGRRLGVLPINAPVGEVVTRVTLGKTKSEKPRLFVGDNGNDEGILIVFKPMYGYRGGVTTKLPNNAEVIASGHVAQGDAGRMGGNNQYVLHFKRESDVHFTFNRTGRLYGEPSEYVVIYMNGSIVCMPLDEYELL